MNIEGLLIVILVIGVGAVSFYTGRMLTKIHYETLIAINQPGKKSFGIEEIEIFFEHTRKLKAELEEAQEEREELNDKLSDLLLKSVTISRNLGFNPEIFPDDDLIDILSDVIANIEDRTEEGASTVSEEALQILHGEDKGGNWPSSAKTAES